PPAPFRTAPAVPVIAVFPTRRSSDLAYNIVTTVTSTDPVYAAIDPADVAVTNTDNDAAGISVSPTSGLVTTEAGGTATFTVVLAEAQTTRLNSSQGAIKPAEGIVPAT